MHSKNQKGKKAPRKRRDAYGASGEKGEECLHQDLQEALILYCHSIGGGRKRIAEGRSEGEQGKKEGRTLTPKKR